ncbi:MAG: hypothetical protein V2A77_04745 [Pseudomonadota bacterium]
MLCRDVNLKVSHSPELSSGRKAVLVGEPAYPDAIYLAGLIVITALYLAFFFNYSAHPYEDAAMLMRYSSNVAGGHGIVWNIGDHPVDGATDFLFMLVLALLSKWGLSIEAAARLVGLLAHVATIIVVYFGIRKLHQLHQGIAFICAAYLAVGPGLRYVEAYFGTPFFAMMACIAWYLALKLTNRYSFTTSLTFALVSLLMGIARPEGVFLAFFMLLAVIYANGIKDSRLILLHFLLVFAMLGGAYFLWRWAYFGYPLPNPFYKKGGGSLYFGSLAASLKHVFILCAPFTILLPAGIRSRTVLRNALLSFIPIIGFAVIWVLLSDEMNYVMRFQYPILPIALMSWASFIRGLHVDWRLPHFSSFTGRNRLALVGTAVVIVVMMLCYPLWYQHPMQHRGHGVGDGRYNVALMLNEYRNRNYTIAVTSAGLLPFYSGWRAVDSWGLNDRWIAHNGAITEEYLDKYKPHVIMMFYRARRRGDDPRSKMTGVMRKYAEAHRYCLAAAFGVSPCETHCYYVRRDFPESKDIITRIRNMNYAWFTNGNRSVNYATLGGDQHL